MGRRVKKGEIRWYKFKPPDKKRPVLILTRNSIIDHLNEVTIAPITSTIRDIPTEILLTKADGLKNDCAINFDHIQTVSKNKIGSVITNLSDAKQEQIKNAVMFAFDL